MTREIMYPPAKRAREAALNPYVHYIMRPPSFPLAIYLHRRNVTANQVTIASGALLGVSLLIGAFAPLAGDNAFAVFLIATIGINLYWFMDVIDGNLARLSRQESPFGQYLENSLYLTAGFVAPLLAGWFAFAHAPIAMRWEAVTGLSPVVLPMLGAVIALARLYRRVLLEMGERIVEKVDPDATAPQSYDRLSVPLRLVYALSGAPLPLLLVATVLNAIPLWLVVYAALTTLTIIYAPISVMRQMRRLTTRSAHKKESLSE